MILVDSNILMDVLANDPVWRVRSQAALVAVPRGEAAIGPPVYAELAFGYDSMDRLNADLRDLGLAYAHMSETGYYLAGRAFAGYRARGGTRTTILADFFVGAHAADVNCPLLTRDPRRYRTAFPDLELIEP